MGATGANKRTWIYGGRPSASTSSDPIVWPLELLAKTQLDFFPAGWIDAVLSMTRLAHTTGWMPHALLPLQRR
jgi:hypothetical protein